MLATADCAPRTLFDPPGGEPMLDEVIVGVWEGLTAHRAVECPVCGAEMRPEYSAHALPVGGRCEGCGTTVS
jgi:ribosomal protein S27E